MSDQDQDISFATTLHSLITFNYCGLAALALLSCEYLVTFPDEIELFWQRRWTGATVLFIMNRYCPLASFFMNNMNFWTLTIASCERYNTATIAITLLEYVPWAGFSALRAYALSSNRAISCFIFALSVVPIVINAVDAGAFRGSVLLPRLGCLSTDSISKETSIGFAVASRSSLMVADILVIAITWARLFKRSDNLSQKHTLMYILLRDGTIYFICLLILNTLHLILSVLSIATVATASGGSYMTVFTDAFTAILVSRFMLNLQAVDHRIRNHTSTLGEIVTHPGTDSLIFQRVIGSLSSSVTEESSVVSEEDAVELHTVKAGQDDIRSGGQPTEANRGG